MIRRVLVLASLALASTGVAHAQTTTTTAPVSVERSTTTANTGPNDYLWVVAAFGLVAVGAGTQMRGRRAAGVHFQ